MKMELHIKNSVKILNCPSFLQEEIKSRLTILNPKWSDNNRLGRWNEGTQKFLKFYTSEQDELSVPKGYIRSIINLSKNFDIPFTIVDKRLSLPEVNYNFHFTLKPFQAECTKKMLKKDFGILNAPTGSGKTIMALYMINKRKQPTLIIVHTKNLAYQWIERINSVFKIPVNKIGLIGDGKNRIGEKITVGMVQTLYKKKEIKDKIGYLIVDECHRTPSKTFNDVVTAFSSKYMTGLSATPWRRDRLSKLIFWFLGDMQHSIDKMSLVEKGDIAKAYVVTRKTDFKTLLNPSRYYTKMLNELISDKNRNNLIARDIAKELKTRKGVFLVLSDRKVHCDNIGAFLKYNFKIESAILTGKLNNKKREDVIKRLNENKIKVLIATGQLIGEGFDYKNFSTLFLTMPIKFQGRLMQYLGRVLRPSKEAAKIFDYVDDKVGLLNSTASKRLIFYQTQGIKIEK